MTSRGELPRRSLKPSDSLEESRYLSAEETAHFLDDPTTEESQVVALLRRRSTPAAFLEAVARHGRWGSSRTVRVAAVHHPKLPRTMGLRLLDGLFWGELLRVASDYRLPRGTRSSAERILSDRLRDLELGERVALARSAPRALIGVLLDDDEPRVVAAVLENPRLTESDVKSRIDAARWSSGHLRVVARSHRWAGRYGVTTALLKNEHTPAHEALRLLANLPRSAMVQLVAGNECPLLVRAAAERRLSGNRATK